jgi:predicted phosphodiesterase
MRTIIIGDIHGCSVPLKALLERLELVPEADCLVLLGDLFDRGPDSWGVLQIVKQLSLEFGKRFVLLRGNHEDYLLQKKLSFSGRRVWERVGRGTSVRSFKNHGEKFEDCAEWIRTQSVLYYKSDGAVFFQCVHAGLRVDPPEANDVWTLVHDHGVVLENVYRGPLTITGHIGLEKPCYFAGDEETVLELEEEKQQSLPREGVICIDAGCGKGGRLIGMVIEDNRFILYGEPEEQIV